MITPPTLSPGDVVAILSPASAVDSDFIRGATAAIEHAGFRARVMPHASGRNGSYSAAASERLKDLNDALADPEVKAILCARGGYGAVHLLPHLDFEQPKWIIGFSDVSALHAAWIAHGWQSVHSSMAKELTLRRCDGDEANRRLFQILTSGKMPEIEWSSHPFNIHGSAEGVLLGGNLAVLNGLASTPFDLMNHPGAILVIEDVAEPIYKVERILWRLRLSGVLDRLNGLIIGQFTDYRPSADHADMYSMMAGMLKGLPYPVAYNAPFGHVDNNLPFIEGINARLTVTSSGTTVSHSER